MTSKSARELFAEARSLLHQTRDAVPLLEAAVDRAIEEEGPEGATVAEALIELSVMRVRADRGDPLTRQECIRLAERGVAITRKCFGRDVRLANALRILGTHQEATQQTAAFASLEEAIEIFEDCSDGGEAARLARQVYCAVALELGRYDEAHRVAARWLTLIPQETARVERISARQVAGRSLLALKRPREAIPHLEDAVQLARELTRENATTGLLQESAQLLQDAEAAIQASAGSENL